MGTIWIPGGSGGADTSVVTATAEDVLAPKVIVGPDGEPIDGTMVNNGAVSHSLPINGSYVIPPGYHNGAGKVSQSIPVQGGSTNVPTTAQKLIVAAGRYVNQNIYIAGDPNFTEANIKKGVTIWGKTGTHSGYVPTATDLYLRGNNISGFVVGLYVSFDSGQISVKEDNNAYIYTNNSINLSGFTKLNIEGYANSSHAKSLVLTAGSGSPEYARISWDASLNGSFTKSIEISNLQLNTTIRLYFNGIGSSSSKIGSIYRIWLS